LAKAIEVEKIKSNLDVLKEDLREAEIVL